MSTVHEKKFLPFHSMFVLYCDVKKHFIEYSHCIIASQTGALNFETTIRGNRQAVQIGLETTVIKYYEGCPE
ncbi:unnamed protein product [Dracunculus medinensis]|uniref:Uncharacterized protein n=1 Tax=Dracunculus medinensis TaxID=318479 RepID=A0A0N4ULI1_DRAME|nr:unnamed protein product [Dracunculus medinensis]